MRLPPATAKQLDQELSQLRHMTPAERAIWATVRQDGSVRRADVLALIEDFARLPAARPTPTEREIMLIVQSNQR